METQEKRVIEDFGRDAISHDYRYGRIDERRIWHKRALQLNDAHEEIRVPTHLHLLRQAEKSSRMSTFRLRISNARQIVQVCDHHEKFKAGKAQNELAVISHGSLVVDHAGKIVAVGTNDQVAAWLQTQPQPVRFDNEVDGSEFCILPGFVDGHTHPVWSGNRVGEFAMKLAGATYMEVCCDSSAVDSHTQNTSLLIYPLVCGYPGARFMKAAVGSTAPCAPREAAAKKSFPNCSLLAWIGCCAAARR